MCPGHSTAALGELFLLPSGGIIYETEVNEAIWTALHRAEVAPFSKEEKTWESPISMTGLLMPFQQWQHAKERARQSKQRMFEGFCTI